jgi:hypothetical protein
MAPVTTVSMPPPHPAPTEPNIDWYLNLSRERSVTPRCPFGSVERCPRYYTSLSLLGNAGSTKIPAAEDERLMARWEQSDLWPKTKEAATSISGSEGRYGMFFNFCPEVSYDRFGLFASGLIEHADEIDRDAAHQMLTQTGALHQSWRWTWAHVTPMHFTECPLYSPLVHSPLDATPRTGEVVTLKPGMWGMNIDLKEAGRRIRSRWRQWRRSSS